MPTDSSVSFGKKGPIILIWLFVLVLNFSNKQVAVFICFNEKVERIYLIKNILSQNSTPQGC